MAMARCSGNASSTDDEFLVEEEFEDVNGDGECSAEADDDIRPVLDLDGEPVPAELDDSELNAINNIGRREQESYGGSIQIGLQSRLFGAENNLTVGVAYSNGKTTFDSALEVASLLENRATTSTGIFAQEFATAVGSQLTSASAYVLDTLNLSDSVAVTVSGRYDDTRIELSDRSGESPELNGNHNFSRFNPAIGVTLRVKSLDDPLRELRRISARSLGSGAGLRQRGCAMQPAQRIPRRSAARAGRCEER